jgi:hypothetical protein
LRETEKRKERNLKKGNPEREYIQEYIQEYISKAIRIHLSNNCISIVPVTH